MAEQIRITDVSPRDGLQNEPRAIPTSEKVELVRALCRARVDEVEVSSFVSARWIPQLGDAAEVFAELAESPGLHASRPLFSALVPNEKGMAGALEANQRAGGRLIGKVSVFTAASETFSKRNTNATIEETIERFKPVAAAAAREGLALRAYVSCIVACPFEGPITPRQVAAVIEKLAQVRDAGRLDEIDLGDTIGAGTPDSIAAVLETAFTAIERWTPGAALTLHMHDTFGTAGACIERALSMGVRSFDASSGGLGGCPYASTPGKRAPGNVSTQLLIEIAQKAGFVAKVDDAALAEASAIASRIVIGR